MGLECSPDGFIARLFDPHSNDVINISFVEAKVVDELGVACIFMSSEEDGSPWGAEGGAHSGAVDLLPEGVAEFEEVVFHYQLDGNQ